MNLGKSNIFKLFLQYTLPAVLGMVVSGIYVIVDGIFVGKYIGPDGLASINIAYPIVYLNIAMGLLFGLGGAALIALKLGEEKKKEAKLILGNTIFLMMVTAIILTTVGMIFLDPILRFLGAKGHIFNMGRDYSRIMIIGSFFTIASVGLNNVVRNDRRPLMATIIMVLGALTNIILDWYFICELGWGVKGAALATIIGQIIPSVTSVVYFFSTYSSIRINLKYLRINNTLKIIKMGLPSFIMQIAMAAKITVENNQLLRYGTEIDVSALSLILYIYSLGFYMCVGVAQGVQPIIGYNYGAKLYKRVLRAMKLGVFTSVFIGIVGFIILFSFPTAIINIFTRDVQLVEASVFNLKLYCLSMPILGVVLMFTAYFQAVGKDKHANFASLSRAAIFLIPALYLLPMAFGVKGVFMGVPTADYLSLIVVGILMYRERKSIIKINNENIELEKLENKNIC